MTLSQIILFPLAHRLVTEASLAETKRGLEGLAQHIERTSPTRVKSGRKAKRPALIAAE